MSEADVKNNDIFFLRLNNSHLPKKFERFKLIKNNANLNDLGEPPEHLDNVRVSPIIEEESCELSSINTSLLIKMVDQKW